MEKQTIKSLAQYARGYFESQDRGEKSIYIMADNIPEWIKDMVHEAHGNMMPDDHVYRFIVDALDLLADNESIDDARDSIESDIYTSGLTEWLHSSNYRVAYIGDVVQEYGTLDNDGFKILGMAQYMERSEVFDDVVSALEKKIECSECGSYISDPTDEFCEDCNAKAAQ